MDQDIPFLFFLWFGLLIHSAYRCHTFEKHPYGPRLCQRLCSSVFGCETYEFEEERLSCFIATTLNPHKSNGKEMIRFDNTLKSLHTCNRPSMIINTRGNRIKCATLKRNQKNYYKPLVWMLFVSAFTRHGKVYSYFPHNKTFHYHPNIPGKYVRCIVGLSKTEILMSTATPSLVFKTRIDRDYRTIFLTGTIVRYMIKEDTENKVYFVGKKETSSHFYIWTMKKLMDVRVVCQLKFGHVNSFAWDSDKNSFIFHYRKQIVEVDKSGKLLRSLTKGISGKVRMSMDNDHNLLYLTFGKAVKGMSSKGKVTEVLQTNVSLLNVRYYDNSIYFTNSDGYLFILGLNRLGQHERTSAFALKDVNVNVFIVPTVWCIL